MELDKKLEMLRIIESEIDELLRIGTSRLELLRLIDQAEVLKTECVIALEAKIQKLKQKI